MSEKMVDISFPIKEDILLSLKETKDEFAKEVLFMSALLLYRKGKLSLGKAAELAGYKNKVQFVEKMQKESEFIFDYTDEEMNEIFKDAQEI